jgi:hypothetical protein
MNVLKFQDGAVDISSACRGSLNNARSRVSIHESVDYNGLINYGGNDPSRGQCHMASAWC